MEKERFLAEITDIRKKYNRAVFDLEKSKENEMLLLSQNKKLAEEREEYKKKLSLAQEEKEKISVHLEEALKKIDLLSCKKAEQNSSEQANQVMNENNLPVAAKISSLQKEKSVLEARLKQMVLGIEQNKRFRPQNEQQCVEEEETEENGFDIEEILDHRKKGSVHSFLVRWKGYGPEGDTWEPKSNLQCKNCKIVNAYMKKNKI